MKHLKKFCDENPNFPLQESNTKVQYTFWQAHIKARDHVFALHQIQRSLRIILAKLNFCFFQWSLGPSQPAKNSKPPNFRYSYLMEPLLYLVFDDEDKFEGYCPVDYELRRRNEFSRGKFSENISQYKSLPTLPAVKSCEEELSEVEALIVSALLSYQEGITAVKREQKFFNFWRGVEKLSQLEYGEHREVVNRCRFLIDVYHEDGIVREQLDEAIEDIVDRRTDVVHRGPQEELSYYDQSAPKVLIDSLLQFYFDYNHDLTKNEFGYILRKGQMSEEELESEIEQLNTKINVVEVLRKLKNDNSG